jgi:hypothetical protein
MMHGQQKVHHAGFTIPIYYDARSTKHYAYVHHRVAIMKFGHLLARSGLKHPELSSMVSPASFYLLV